MSEVEPFTVEDLALTIQGKMIRILADQHMGQKARTGAATFDGARRQRRLNEALAAGAGQPGPHDAVHDEAAGHVFQFLGYILPDPAQAPATVSASFWAMA